MQGGRTATVSSHAPPSRRPQARSRGLVRFPWFPWFFPFSLLRNLVGEHHIFLEQAWAEGNGVLATCCHRADSGQETGCATLATIYLGRMRVTIKKKTFNDGWGRVKA